MISSSSTDPYPASRWKPGDIVLVRSPWFKQRLLRAKIDDILPAGAHTIYRFLSPSLGMSFIRSESQLIKDNTRASRA